MARFKLDQDVLGLSSALEKLAHVRVKDSFRENDMIFFIVSPGQLGKALGKGAQNIKKLETQFGKRVRVIEFRDCVEDFIKNVIYPVKVEKIIVEEGLVILNDSSNKVKGQLIGRDSKNLEVIKRAVKRFFDVDVKVE